jgi:hypothetical protein
MSFSFDAITENPPPAIPKSDSSLQTPKVSHIKGQGRAAHPGSVTIGTPKYQSVESERSSSGDLWNLRILYANPVYPSRSQHRPFFGYPDRGRPKSPWPGKADLTLAVLFFFFFIHAGNCLEITYLLIFDAATVSAH